MADGYADTPPAALRHPTAQVVASLTRKVVLVGRNETHKLNVTPREVNRFIACAASGWIAGPTKIVVEQAIPLEQSSMGRLIGAGKQALGTEADPSAIARIAGQILKGER